MYYSYEKNKKKTNKKYIYIYKNTTTRELEKGEKQNKTKQNKTKTKTNKQTKTKNKKHTHKKQQQKTKNNKKKKTKKKKHADMDCSSVYNWFLSRQSRHQIFDNPEYRILGDNFDIQNSSYVTCRVNILFRVWKIKTLIRLRGCAGWSASLLFAYGISMFFFLLQGVLLTEIVKLQRQFAMQPSNVKRVSMHGKIFVSWNKMHFYEPEKSFCNEFAILMFISLNFSLIVVVWCLGIHWRQLSFSPKLPWSCRQCGFPVL